MGVVDYSTDTVRFKIRKHPLYLNIFVCFFFVSILLFCILLFNLWFIVCDAISVLFWFLFCFCTFHDGLPMTIWLHWLVMCNSFLYWHGHWLGKIKNFLVVVVVQQFVQMQYPRLLNTLQSSTFAIGLCLWMRCCDTKGIVQLPINIYCIYNVSIWVSLFALYL